MNAENETFNAIKLLVSGGDTEKAWPTGQWKLDANAITWKMAVPSKRGEGGHAINFRLTRDGLESDFVQPNAKTDNRRSCLPDTRLTTDEIVELVKRIEEKLSPICDHKALRSRIHRAVAEYSEALWTKTTKGK